MKTSFGIIYESAKSESFMTDNSELSQAISEVSEQLDSIATLDNDIIYTAEMVNVIESVQNDGTALYVVEAENLAKYMKSAGLEIGELQKAIADVASANGVEVNNITLVVESQAVYDDLIQEAKKVKTKSSKPLTPLNGVKKLISSAKNKGIQVFKRK